MTMSHEDKHIHFKKLEKNVYYLEGEPGGNATKVNAALWDVLTDEDMPSLIDGAYTSSNNSSDDNSNFSTLDIPDLFDRRIREKIDGKEDNGFTSIFLESAEKPTLSSTRSWTDAVLNKNNVAVDAYVNNLNTTEENPSQHTIVVSDNEDDGEVPEVSMQKKTVRIMPESGVVKAGKLKVVQDQVEKLTDKSN